MRAKATTILAGMLCMLLGACNSIDPNSSTASRSGDSYSNTASTGRSSGTAGNTNGTASTGGMESMTSNAATSGNTMGNGTGSTDLSGNADKRTSTTNNAMSTDGSQSGVAIASATVQSIENVPRAVDRSSGETQSGSSGTAGTTSGSMAYRVNLRLDDGTTRAIMQNAQPTYQIGDRVKVVNGLLQRY